MKTIYKNELTPKVQILEQYLDDMNQLQELTQTEAEKIISDITETLAKKESHHKNLRQLVYTLEVYKAHNVLGCDSLHKCLKKYFNGKSLSEVYKEAKAARIEVSVSPISQIGEIPKSILLEIGKLKNVEDQLSAWSQGMKMRKDGKKFPTAITMLGIVKNMYLNSNAEITDPRVTKNWNASEEEKLEKQKMVYKKQIKSYIEKQQDGEAKLNSWYVMLEIIKELQSELQMPSLLEFVFPVIGKTPEFSDDDIYSEFISFPACITF